MSDQTASSACANCGSAAPPGATFCPTCGTPLNAAAPWMQPPSSPGLSDADSRNWATGAHASALLTSLVGGVSSFIGPLVVWLVRRDSDPFVAEHAREALNFNITVDAIVLIALALGFLTLGIGFLILGPILLIVGVVWLVCTIQATVAASRGEPYRYPMSVRIIN